MKRRNRFCKVLEKRVFSTKEERLQARKGLVGLRNRKANVPEAWCLGKAGGQDTDWQVSAGSHRVLVNSLDFILRAMPGLWKVF